MAETISPVSYLTTPQCWELLNSNEFGRLALSVSNQPEIFPINYTVQDDTLLFRTAPGTKLSAAVLGAKIAFEVDSASPGWSVLVRGHAEELRDPALQTRARSLLGHDWPAGERDHIVRIRAEQVTGRKLPPAV